MSHPRRRKDLPDSWRLVDCHLCHKELSAVSMDETLRAMTAGQAEAYPCRPFGMIGPFCYCRKCFFIARQTAERGQVVTILQRMTHAKPTAGSKEKPFCRNGHAMTGDNVYRWKSGDKVSRACRQCISERRKDEYRRKKKSPQTA